MSTPKRSRSRCLLALLLSCVCILSTLSPIAFATGGTDPTKGDLLFKIPINYFTMDCGEVLKDTDGRYYISARPSGSGSSLKCNLGYIDLPRGVDFNLTFNFYFHFEEQFGMGSGDYSSQLFVMFLDGSGNEMQSYDIFNYKGKLKSKEHTILPPSSAGVPYLEKYTFTAPKGASSMKLVYYSTAPVHFWTYLEKMELYGFNMDKATIQEFQKANAALDKNNQLQEENNETQKGILQKIKELPERIGEKIQSLFVPTEEQITAFKDKMDLLLTDHLGAVYQAPKLMHDFMQKLVDYNPDGKHQIILPKQDFSYMGHSMNLWDQQIVDFDKALQVSPHLVNVYNIYRSVVCPGVLVLGLIALAIKKYHSIIGG